MKAIKQEIVMSILATGLYEIDVLNGVVYANRKRGKVKLLTNLLPTGYKQITLFKGRGTGIKTTVYLHQLVWLAANGKFDESMQIDHINCDKSNNAINNLRVVTARQNVTNLLKSKPYPTKCKTIRMEQITAIKDLIQQGLSQSAIAKAIDRNRLTVRYIIKNIQSGLPLKYDK